MGPISLHAWGYELGCAWSWRSRAGLGACRAFRLRRLACCRCARMRGAVCGVHGRGRMQGLLIVHQRLQLVFDDLRRMMATERISCRDPWLAVRVGECVYLYSRKHLVLYIYGCI